ncbi:hypothetical protein KXR64_20495 [Brucella intermedia]|uniref:hypothetical protein n=1 Tax=Brucella TaxID=234 RepID=UPI0009462354|nr:hypothetical protein [Brucella intermedia]
MEELAGMLNETNENSTNSIGGAIDSIFKGITDTASGIIDGATDVLAKVDFETVGDGLEDASHQVLRFLDDTVDEATDILDEVLGNEESDGPSDFADASYNLI